MNQRGRWAALAVVAAGLIHLGRRLERVEVDGASMRPGLVPGDRLLVVRGGPVRPGAIVALDDPRGTGRVMVKRVAARRAGTVTVLGDDPEASTDSRHFGPIDIKAIHGPAWYRYSPAARAGWLVTLRPRRSRRTSEIARGASKKCK